MPMIACWVSHTCHLYVLYFQILFFPKYLRDVQGFNIKEIGDLAALPQALTSLVIFGGSYVADMYKAKGYPHITIRRTVNFCGSVVPAAILCCYYFVSCQIALAMGIMITCQSLMGFQTPGSKVKTFS